MHLALCMDVASRQAALRMPHREVGRTRSAQLCLGLYLPCRQEYKEAQAPELRSFWTSPPQTAYGLAFTKPPECMIVLMGRMKPLEALDMAISCVALLAKAKIISCRRGRKA